MLQVFDKIKFYLIGGLGAALLVSNVGWYISYDLKSDALNKSKWAHAETILRYDKAQKEAEALSLKAALEKERENNDKARKADEAYDTLMRKYNTSIVRYQAAQRTPSTIDLSSTSKTSDGSNTTSENTRILITISDAHICAENTARIQAVHDWAKSLETK